MTEYLEAYLIGEAILPESDEFEPIREVLRPEYSDLTDGEIAELLEDVYAGMTPEEILAFEGIEGFLKGAAKMLGAAAGKAAPTVLTVTGTLGGTAVGTLAGGPAGALAGGMAGGMAGKALGKKVSQAATPKPKPPAPTRRAAAAAPSPMTSAPPAGPRPALRRPGTPSSRPTQLPRRPAAVPAAPKGQMPATNQIMILVQHPAFLKSLMGQALGPAGRRTVKVGANQTQVPAGAMMNTLASLAKRAATEFQESGENVEALSYLLDQEGNFLVDPANPEERADRLMELLLESDEEDYEELAEAEQEMFDPITEWFLKSGFIR